ncbi:MAG: universal stress protein, partial [Pseudomonadota bacterium]
MAYKDLLVHVDSETVSGATIDAALALAERHDAHLVGLGIRAPLEIPLYAEVRLPDPVFELMKEREDGRLAEAKADFESRAKHAGRTERCEWR